MEMGDVFNRMYCMFIAWLYVIPAVTLGTLHFGVRILFDILTMAGYYSTTVSGRHDILLGR